jgi:ribosomal protein S1
VNKPSDDFATLFEASIKAKRFEKGRTLDGTIVAIGPEVAFVEQGGNGDAEADWVSAPNTAPKTG